VSVRLSVCSASAAEILNPTHWETAASMFRPFSPVPDTFVIVKSNARSVSVNCPIDLDM